MRYLINLKPADKQLLKFLNRVGKKIKNQLYLVGGSVRDVLLGEKNWDIDIVATGNTDLLAKKIQQKFRVKIIAYPRFRTFVVCRGATAADHWFDLATARRERYKYPGALPDVFPVKKIVADLPRRDFTINALALPLTVLEKNKWKNFNDDEVIDCCGGLNDLKKKILRVIKPDGFTEDPTRIFRAARFVCRFGLKLSSETRKALFQARKNLPVISPARRYQELKYIFLEKNPGKVFALLKKWRVLRYLVQEKPELLKLFLNYPDKKFPDSNYLCRLKILGQIAGNLSEEFFRFFQVPREIRRRLSSG